MDMFKFLKKNAQSAKVESESLKVKAQKGLLADKVLVENAEENNLEVSEGKFSKAELFSIIARWCFYTLIFLLPWFFLPWTVAPAEINKQFLAVFLSIIILVCWLLRVLIGERMSYPKSFLSVAIIIFLAILSLSSIFAKAPLLSVWGNFSQSDALLTFLLGGALFFMAPVFLRFQDFKRVLGCFLSGILVLTVLEFLWAFQKFSFDVAGSTFIWVAYLAMGFVVVVAVLSGGLVASKKIKTLLWIVCAALWVLLAILNYWNVWLAVALCMAVLISHKFYKSKSLISSDLFFPATVMIVAILLMFIGQYLPSIFSFPVEVKLGLGANWEIIKGAFHGKQIFLGSGPGTFGYEFELLKPLSLNQTMFWQTRFGGGFNFISTMAVTTGILGILALLLLIAAFLRLMVKLYSPNQDVQEYAKTEEIFIPVFLGTLFLVISWFLNLSSFAQNIFVFLGMGMTVGVMQKTEQLGHSFRTLSIKWALACFWAVILLIALGLGGAYINGLKYAAAVYYGKGINYYQENNLAQSITSLNKVVTLESQSDQYARTFSRMLFSKAMELINQNKGKPSDETTAQVKNLIAASINEGQRATTLVDADSLNFSNLGLLYESLAQLKQGTEKLAAQSYQKAVDLNPKNPGAYIDLARALLLEKQESQAKDALKTALSLKPNYEGAYYFLGSLDYQDNNLDSAQTNLENAVLINANYSDAMYLLGLVYDKKGMRSSAINQFEAILKLNPGNAEVQKILNNLKNGKAALSGVSSVPNVSAHETISPSPSPSPTAKKK